MTELSFTVEGIPAPQGSKRAFNHRHTGRVVMIESAGDRLKVWRQTVTLKARSVAAQQSWEPPAAVTTSVQFYLPRPKSHYRTGRFAGQLKPSAPLFHVTKPDSDKLLRAINDALTDAGVIRDDATITNINVQKTYADTTQPAHESPSRRPHDES